MATYQGEKFLEAQLTSIWECLEPGDEIIVSDDGSTDATLSILSEYVERGCPILIFANKEKAGNTITNNFINAISHCRNPIVVFCDQDDVWLPNRLAVVRELHSTYDCVVVDGNIVTDDQFTAERIYQHRTPSTSLIRNFYKLSVLGCQLSFRRSALLSRLKVPKDRHITHDWWFYMNALLNGRVLVLSESVFGYRRHGGNASNGIGQSDNPIMLRILIRFKMIKHLVFAKGQKRGYEADA
uniref:glycosyltransferase n=1 Tax=uncultured Altererythrobacter sp. TaxID=500840 RepID=UPI002601A553|nr:glycosyltransferase [uncultured Altererythrobacter sp.]